MAVKINNEVQQRKDRGVPLFLFSLWGNRSRGNGLVVTADLVDFVESHASQGDVGRRSSLDESSNHESKEDMKRTRDGGLKNEGANTPGRKKRRHGGRTGGRMLCLLS